MFNRHNSMSYLKAAHLQKTYHDRMIVKNISLQVQSGEIVGLLGPNGAGKTTAFYMMIGLVPHDAGEIYVDERAIGSLTIDQRARLGIGYLPQEPSIFRRLTTADNIRAILELRHLSATEQQHQLHSLLKEFHLEAVQHHMGYTLSGGERRRVEIARSLAAAPRFMLLDEPFAGIDPLSVRDIKQMIRHLKELKIGVLITDHNVRETLDICDKAYIVNQGEIICEGGSNTILDDQKVREVYLGHEFEL